jgi:catechol 2,3-dioxygenase-like lactoylglutathione lyase family enzyme
MEISFDHCVIHVSERARSNAFYRDVLCATLVGDADGPAMYRFGRQQLNVHGPGLSRTRLRGFRSGRAEAISASRAAEASTARSTTSALTA